MLLLKLRQVESRYLSCLKSKTKASVLGPCSNTSLCVAQLAVLHPVLGLGCVVQIGLISRHSNKLLSWACSLGFCLEKARS